MKSQFGKYLRPGKESETLLINQVSLLRLSNNQTTYKFGFGQSPFPVPVQISNALAQAAPRKEYMSVQGHLPLRQTIADFHNQMENRNFNAENIIVGSGSKIIIFSIMAAFKNAEVLLPAPSWVSYEPQAELLGHKVDWVETEYKNKWRLTPEGLDEFCNARKNPEIPLILVLNYPNNPTGQSFDSNELKSLAIVLKKHEVIVIADEIYSLLRFDKTQSSIADYYPEGSIITSGLSKWCGAGGWRLGFSYVPPQLGKELFNAIIGVASETYSCAAAPIQIAATKAYADSDLAKEFLKHQIDILKQVNSFCTKPLNECGIKVHPCVGGFYLFPDFSKFKKQLAKRNIHTSQQLISVLMEEIGVALLPGTAFGMKPNNLTARLAFVDFDGSQILKNTNKCDFQKVKAGINALCAWFIAL